MPQSTIKQGLKVAKINVGFLSPKAKSGADMGQHLPHVD